MLSLLLEAPVHFLSFRICHILKSLITEVQKHCFLQAWDYYHAHSSQFLLFLSFCILLPLHGNFWKNLLSPKTAKSYFSRWCAILMYSSWVPKCFKLVFWALLRFIPKWHGIQASPEYLKSKIKYYFSQLSDPRTKARFTGIFRAFDWFWKFWEVQFCVLKCSCNKPVAAFWHYIIYFVWRLILALPSEQFCQCNMLGGICLCSCATIHALASFPYCNLDLNLSCTCSVSGK